MNSPLHGPSWATGVNLLILNVFMAAVATGMALPEPPLHRDSRAIADRLDSRKNPGNRDDSFMNAIGAVWPYVIERTEAGYPASTGVRAATGFLIDGCHVLTNLHVAYGDPIVADPPMPYAVSFGVGQTATDKDRGALQGLKYLLRGEVIAHGDAIILDALVHHPEEDWALLRLTTGIPASISPLTCAAVEPTGLSAHYPVSAAGYPSDHRMRRGDGFKLKDLWTADGEVVGVHPVSPSGSLLLTTIQATAGDSGAPVFADFPGHPHLVIGMVQSVRGNGIDASETAPNVELLFTAGMMARIAAAKSQYPCH